VGVRGALKRARDICNRGEVAERKEERKGKRVFESFIKKK
jgi:hypothetical protein